ncbi:hypothetical protein B1NLA3E_05560 [Bacillus sp. 1NLA3E]|nr:hypothetical protein B1NLA3E_05560 [Bacillus sp. 1NLA3E]
MIIFKKIGMVIELNEQTINEIFNKLKSKELNEFFVKKEDFLPVRKVLVNRDDFKHIRGIALRGGDVMYQYTDDPRS